MTQYLFIFLVLFSQSFQTVKVFHIIDQLIRIRAWLYLDHEERERLVTLKHDEFVRAAVVHPRGRDTTCDNDVMRLVSRHTGLAEQSRWIDHLLVVFVKPKCPCQRKDVRWLEMDFQHSQGR